MVIPDELFDSQQNCDVVQEINSNNEIPWQGVGGSGSGGGEGSISPSVQIDESDDASSVVEDDDANDDVNVEEEEVDEIFQRKRKKESSVWRYGTKLKDGSKCNICGKFYKSKQGNTSNLIAHIKLKHKDTEAAVELTKELTEAREIKKQKLAAKNAEKRQQSSLLNFVRRSGTLDKKKKEKITEAIAEFIIEDANYFDIVEKQTFRKMLFTCEPDYIVPSRRTITRKIDEKADSCKGLLRKEILTDLEDAGHKTISITCDEGTSSDRFNTKKLAVTIHRTTADFEVKSDTLAVDPAVGSQTAATIRSEVKAVLVRFGYDSTWTVNWTTDGASAMISARAKGRHNEVGLETNHTGTCTDHSLHLVVEDASEKVLDIKNSLLKVRKMVEFFKQSSLSRQILLKIQNDSGISPLSVVQGTDNRWYFRYSEVKRMVELKSSIIAFQEQYYENIPDRLDLIEVEDWPLITAYVKAVDPFVKATAMFGGGNYITSSIVIPVLDQMSTDLTKLYSSPDTEREVKNLANHLIQGLRKRFPSNFLNLAPYNCLTFLDPHFVDLYADTPELMSTITTDIIYDACYSGMDTVVAPESTSAAGSSTSTPPDPPASDRRSQLLRKKMALHAAGSGANQEELPLREKIMREIER